MSTEAPEPFNPAIVGQERPMLVVSGPITEDPMDITSVTLQAGVPYNIDEDGNIRDQDGNFCCKLQIWRKFPHTFQQQEAWDTIAVVEELSNRVPYDDNHYPGWLRVKVKETLDSLRAVLGSYRP
jgi:hypothetical protein